MAKTEKLHLRKGRSAQRQRQMLQKSGKLGTWNQLCDEHVSPICLLLVFEKSAIAFWAIAPPTSHQQDGNEVIIGKVAVWHFGSHDSVCCHDNATRILHPRYNTPNFWITLQGSPVVCLQTLPISMSEMSPPMSHTPHFHHNGWESRLVRYRRKPTFCTSKMPLSQIMRPLHVHLSVSDTPRSTLTTTSVFNNYITRRLATVQRTTAKMFWDHNINKWQWFYHHGSNSKIRWSTNNYPTQYNGMIKPNSVYMPNLKLRPVVWGLCSCQSNIMDKTLWQYAVVMKHISVLMMVICFKHFSHDSIARQHVQYEQKLSIVMFRLVVL